MEFGKIPLTRLGPLALVALSRRGRGLRFVFLLHRLFAFRLIGFLCRNGIAPAQPAVEVDVGAASGAERMTALL
jgi:hypothetical protein